MGEGARRGDRPTNEGVGFKISDIVDARQVMICLGRHQDLMEGYEVQQGRIDQVQHTTGKVLNGDHTRLAVTRTGGRSNGMWREVK